MQSCGICPHKCISPESVLCCYTPFSLSQFVDPVLSALPMIVPALPLISSQCEVCEGALASFFFSHHETFLWNFPMLLPDPDRSSKHVLVCTALLFSFAVAAVDCCGERLASGGGVAGMRVYRDHVGGVGCLRAAA